MPIKLTPEHVGTRVLLSDDSVHFVTDMTDTHYWLTEVGVPDESLVLKLDGLDDEDDPPITLLLDAPNPLDVEVPEWCEWIYVYRSPHSSAPPWVVHKSGWPDFLANPPIHVDGWSPAPGQMPPREAADDGE